MQALFISDIHLQPTLPKTTQTFLTFLKEHATKANQLYILGDLFEYWAGDDTLAHPYLQSIVSAIANVSQLGTQVFWLCGNRDFLTGENFLKSTGAIALPDTAVVSIGETKLALTHGDNLCTDDKNYIEFRTMVRNPAWQKQFLSMPLEKRLAVIQDMRAKSMKDNQQKNTQIMEVNDQAVKALFEKTQTKILIHGHTHRPNTYTDNGFTRYVLSDWQMDNDTRRGDYLCLSDDGKIDRIAL